MDTTGAYLQIRGAGEVSINNGGKIVFGATLDAGGRGFFDGADPAADTVIAIGDVLAGSTVIDLPMNAMNPRALNNAGQFLFRADLADGRRVLVRAEPNGEEHQGLPGFEENSGGQADGDTAFSMSLVLSWGFANSSAADELSPSNVAFVQCCLQGDSQAPVPNGFVTDLDQYFASVEEDETLWPVVDNDPWSITGDLEMDLVRDTTVNR